MKKILAILLSSIIVLSLTACSGNSDSQNTAQTSATAESTESVSELDKVDWVDYAQYNLDENSKVKNIILMIGDGMGENIIKASEIVKGDKLVMSGMNHSAYVTTYSQSVTDKLADFTDSAASATALSTGVKTLNGRIGVDAKGNKLETICEFASNLGLRTGLVDRHYVSHATPAGMAAHNEDRGNYGALLRDMIKTGVNVMLGGGSQFYDDSKKTQKIVANNNYKYISTEKELLSLSSKDSKVLGMFAYDNMGRADMTPSLTTMTSKALDVLDNDNGFFLMVEGSNIDVFESQSNMSATLEQMQSFDKTVDYVLKWAEKKPGTLVIVTADHETGGVKIPKNATADKIDDSCFTSNGNHTNTNVLLMASGAKSAELCKEDVIDNTDIAKYMRKVLNDTYKKAD